MSIKLEVFEQLRKLENAWRKAEREFRHAILELNDDDRRAYVNYRQRNLPTWVQE